MWDKLSLNGSSTTGKRWRVGRPSAKVWVINQILAGKLFGWVLVNPAGVGFSSGQQVFPPRFGRTASKKPKWPMWRGVDFPWEHAPVVFGRASAVKVPEGTDAASIISTSVMNDSDMMACVRRSEGAADGLADPARARTADCRHPRRHCLIRAAGHASSGVGKNSRAARFPVARRGTVN